MTTSADEWVSSYAAAVGAGVPDEDDVDTLLALAGVAAHASERTAAPLTCWLAAVAGLSPVEALEVATRLSGELGGAGTVGGGSTG